MSLYVSLVAEKCRAVQHAQGGKSVQFAGSPVQIFFYPFSNLGGADFGGKMEGCEVGGEGERRYMST